MALLRSLGLVDLVDDTDLCPLLTVTAPPTFSQMVVASSSSPLHSSVTDKVNPLYQQWDCKDQMLLTWIMQYLSDEVLSSVNSVNTLSEAWHVLETAFGTPSHTHIVQLTIQIHNLKKGDLSVATYSGRLGISLRSFGPLGMPSQMLISMLLFTIICRLTIVTSSLPSPLDPLR